METTSGSFTRYVFATIVRGFLLGIGLSVAMGATFYVTYQATMKQSQKEFERIAAPSESAAKDFVLSDVEELKHDGSTSIIGSVKNIGKSKAQSVRIEANLFNHGKFVDQYSTYISASLAPGDSRNFKIACGCSAPPAEHDSYKLEVVP